MKLFLDSADIEEIKKVKSYGILEGVTTNPSLIKKAAEKHKIKNLETYIKKLLKICKTIPVSLEVIGTDYKEMVREGKILHKKFNKVSKNVYVKIPINPCLKKSCSMKSDGIKAIQTLHKLKIKINCTLIFTPEQANFAAKAGANYVSPFVGREDDYLREMARIKFEKSDYFPKDGFKNHKKMLEDNGLVSGVDLIKKINKNFKRSKTKTKILAASIRNQKQLRECEDAGANIATVPFPVIEKLISHPKTLEGMKKFTKDIVPEYKKMFKKS
jgi:transaldolase